MVYVQKPSEEAENKLMNGQPVTRIARRRSRSEKAPATSMGGEERENSAYQVLVDRCRSLEENQAKLREQFDELVLQNKKLTVRDDEQVIADSTAGSLSSFFFSGSPYASVLKCMGHAVHVHRVSSGEIIYW